MLLSDSRVPIQLQPQLRTTVRAFIQQGDQLLMVQKYSPEKGVYFGLPGGEQEADESLEQAVVRECKEELSAKVNIGPMLWVADYYRKRSGCKDVYRHIIDHVFQCELKGNYTPKNGPEPDRHQQSVVWVPIDALHDVYLAEPYLLERLANISAAPSAYVGAFHDDPNS
ncbi:ADP-ribose pyrophosphatase [Bacterioplanes sanyensis]|uniref:NUDIX domain-containing protein n=1 Tax=Bacterioplanes sanyensis TaxID=1249553 RepID=UPI0016796BD4|nr:NUDIX domain-containing protein [Bacterioplanes sanyensis]GGY47961.1 ADP-ribose pyrophosphatase [Bacterioplanes sanyensis]